MLRFSGSSQNPGSSVLDELQLSNGLLWKAGEETITIIHPAGDKGMNKFLQVMTGNKTSNSWNSWNIKITPAQKESGVCTCIAFVFKDSLLSSVFAGKGFSEVADWLRVQESLKWFLAGFEEFWAGCRWQT